MLVAAGVALLAGPDLFGSSAGSGVAIAVGEVLFVALCYATGPLIANSKLSGVPAVAMTAASLAFAMIVYAPLAHWVWGGGFLADMGAWDFAGGTVVHVNAGVAALVAAMVVGRRTGDVRIFFLAS